MRRKNVQRKSLATTKARKVRIKGKSDFSKKAITYREFFKDVQAGILEVEDKRKEISVLENSLAYLNNPKERKAILSRISVLKKDTELSSDLKKKPVSALIRRRNLISHLLSQYLKRTKIDIKCHKLTFQQVVTNIYNSTKDTPLRYIEQNFDEIFKSDSGISDLQSREVEEEIAYYQLATEIIRPSYEGFSIMLRCIFIDADGQPIDVWFPNTEKFDATSCVGGDRQDAIDWYEPIKRELRRIEANYIENNVSGFYPYFKLMNRVGDSFLFYQLELFEDGEDKFKHWGRVYHGLPEKQEKSEIKEAPGRKKKKKSSQLTGEGDEMLNLKILERQKEIELEKQKKEEHDAKERATKAENELIKNKIVLADKIIELKKLGMTTAEIKLLLGIS